jgi:hypothetical protein
MSDSSLFVSCFGSLHQDSVSNLLGTDQDESWLNEVAVTGLVSAPLAGFRVNP